VLEDHPDCPLADLLGIPACACHDSILSRNGASGKPRAVHLIGSGMILGGLTVWLMLPRLWNMLPRDRGRLYTPDPDAALGKPTGAGALVVLLFLPVLFLVMPFSVRLWCVAACLFVAMLMGYLDDRSERPWGEWRKGSLDLVIAVAASLVMCRWSDVTVWLPVVKEPLVVSPFLYVPVASVMLWFTMNATNCSDGVDGLAGTLTSLSLFYLGGFLYAVIGHVETARYLLVPHDPDGARWAIMLFTAAGTLGGYLWFNAEPSRILMGDAGSRFLGLLVGVAVLATGNPFLVIVVAPVVLANGGTGLVKIVLLRIFKRLGFDATPPASRTADAGASEQGRKRNGQSVAVRVLHQVRFPLHDHCRKELGWSNAQVLLRFLPATRAQNTEGWLL